MQLKFLLFIILIVWGLPSSYFRSKFRKIVYKTNHWSINIKPLFVKELKALFFNIYPDNTNYVLTRNYYRFYLLIYLIIFLIYLITDDSVIIF
jgi:peroxiredoxin Q/BCP